MEYDLCFMKWISKPCEVELIDSLLKYVLLPINVNDKALYVQMAVFIFDFKFWWAKGPYCVEEGGPCSHDGGGM